MKAAKTDANQKAIVAVLRKAGASVQILSIVGRGFPDLLVGYRGINYLMEVKSLKGKLNNLQLDWMGKWRGQKCIVHTVDHALERIGVKP